MQFWFIIIIMIWIAGIFCALEVQCVPGTVLRALTCICLCIFATVLRVGAYICYHSSDIQESLWRTECVFLKRICWNAPHSVWCYWGGSSEQVTRIRWDHEGGPLVNVIRALQRVGGESSFPFCALCPGRMCVERSSTCSPRQDSDQNHSDLHIYDPNVWEILFYCFQATWSIVFCPSSANWLGQLLVTESCFHSFYGKICLVIKFWAELTWG